MLKFSGFYLNNRFIIEETPLKEIADVIQKDYCDTIYEDGFIGYLTGFYDISRENAENIKLKVYIQDQWYDCHKDCIYFWIQIYYYGKEIGSIRFRANHVPQLVSTVSINNNAVTNMYKFYYVFEIDAMTITFIDKDKGGFVDSGYGFMDYNENDCEFDEFFHDNCVLERIVLDYFMDYFID